MGAWAVLRGSRQLLGGETVAWSADGGPRITDRDLVAVAVAAEHLMAAQIHRFKKVAEVIMARDCEGR